ncbi:MAG TPA: hypothetical protein VG323_04100 [Thermoanaerobaculia bacterium]|nr:hypothetical protein [Thermoanaerobaculia bacterium]
MLNDKLRDEIIESQKAQNDLVKWKLILVAAIGATGLGAVPNAPKNAALLLALIPLVCIYVDAVCFHFEIRIMTIARFFRSQAGDDQAYEQHCVQHRTGFALISVALFGASLVLSGLVLFVGVCLPMQELLGVTAERGPVRVALGTTGTLGLVGSVLFYRFCRNRNHWLDQAKPNAQPPSVWRFFWDSVV